MRTLVLSGPVAGTPPPLLQHTRLTLGNESAAPAVSERPPIAVVVLDHSTQWGPVTTCRDRHPHALLVALTPTPTPDDRLAIFQAGADVVLPHTAAADRWDALLLDLAERKDAFLHQLEDQIPEVLDAVQAYLLGDSSDGEFFDIFQRNVLASLAELETAYAQRHLNTVGTVLHGIKAGFHYFGFEALFEHANELDHRARAIDPGADFDPTFDRLLLDMIESLWAVRAARAVYLR